MKDGAPDFSAMTAAALNDWYEEAVGYRPQVDDPTMSDDTLRSLCIGYAEEAAMHDPHAICRKWVRRIGLGFHPDTRGIDYSPKMDAEQIGEYDADMGRLFDVAEDPYECAVMAMADAGLC